MHAEANAILHKTCIDLKGCTLYVTLFPCNECTKLIIQSGIEKIYYLEGEPQIPSVDSATNTGEEAKPKTGEEAKAEGEKGTPPKADKLYTVSSRRLFEMAGYTLLPFNSREHGRSKYI